MTGESQDHLRAVRAFITEMIGVRDFSDDVDIEDKLGCYGDDMWEFLEAYSTKFQVDMSDFRWYFHSGEEGWNIGGVIHPPPNTLASRIPITPLMLAEFATTKKWAINYPEHQVPGRRKDLAFNKWLMILLFCAVLIAACVALFG